MRLPYKFKDLGLSIDVDRIRRELARVPPASWVRHGFHETGHDVLALLSTGGTLTHADGSINNALLPPFLPTAHLKQLPYVRDLIYSFGTQPHRVRFAKMRPGQTITPHRDLQPNWYDKVRLHIPIVTDPQVLVHIWEENDELRPEDRTDVHFAAGSGWVFDTWRVHAVTNFSDVERIHLIIDFEPLGKLFSLMFDDVDPQLLKRTLSFEYPRHYTTDRSTMNWLTGGQIEIGEQLWSATILDRNPQVNRYRHAEPFWAS